MCLRYGKPKLIQTADGEDIVNKVFGNFLDTKNKKKFPRYTSKGTVIEENCNRSIRKFLQKFVYETSDNKWMDILPFVTKQYNRIVHLRYKFTPVNDSLKKKESFVIDRLNNK